MKHLIRQIVILLLAAPTLVVAEELPVLWLEAGKENEFRTITREGPINWTLRFEHRTLDGALSFDDKPAPRPGQRTLKIKTPPLKPGMMMRTQLLFGNLPYRNVVIASSEPFEDKKAWCDAHPIALYDPEGKTSEIFEREEIPFKILKSFQEISFQRSKLFDNVENTRFPAIVVGEDTDFERTKGLTDLLCKYSEAGGSVLILSPRLGEGISLELGRNVRSLTLTDDTKCFFPLATGHFNGDRWMLRPVGARIALVGETMAPYLFADEVSQCRGFGPSILDIRFAHPLEATGNSPSLGRIVFIGKPIVSRWENDVESRYYFKALIEKLSENGEKP